MFFLPDRGTCYLILKSLPASDDGLQNIRYEQLLDPTCATAIKYCQKKWSSNKNLDYSLQPYKKVSADLSHQHGPQIKGCRLVIPKSISNGDPQTH